MEFFILRDNNSYLQAKLKRSYFRLVGKLRKIVRDVFLNKTVIIVKADIIDTDIDVKEDTL